MKSPCDTLVILFGSFVIGTIHAAPKKDVKSKEVWVSDLIDYDYMGDAPATGSDFCPPVPSVLPSGSCSQTPCSSDRACTSGKCCYNGCIYTCLYQVGFPGYFDWPKEPRRRLSSGRSWLVDSPESVNEAESCSTTPVDNDEDPLLCPHGYVCNIEDQGDPKKGIPNRGRCVVEKDGNMPQKGDASTPQPPLFLGKLKQKLQNTRVCEEKDGYLILEGARVQRDGRECICRRGDLVCRDRTSRKFIVHEQKDGQKQQ